MLQVPGHYGWTLGDVDPQLAEKVGVPSTVETTNPVKPMADSGETQVVAEVTRSLGFPAPIVWLMLIVGGLVALKALTEGHFWKG